MRYSCEYVPVTRGAHGQRRETASSDLGVKAKGFKRGLIVD